jgi:hypothetical protein
VIKKFSFPERNREFSFAPKLQYELAATPLAAGSGDLQFLTVCRTIELARTVFSTPTEVKSETPDAAEPHR